MLINIVLYIAFIIFLTRIIVFFIGSIIERKKGIKEKPKGELPFVSIVVPARNEEKTIADCIISIANSNYPNDKFEIIAVDDRSSDNTKNILADLNRQYNNLKVITLSKDSTIKNLNGKPGALQAGIDNAKAEIILMTDADCTVNPDWVFTMSSLYQNNDLGMAAGYTGIKAKKAFEWIQAVEWTYLHTIATAGIGLNIPLSCYGNNISVLKRDFTNIGGYHSVGFSVTEDLALLNSIHKSGRKLQYLTHYKSTIETKACPTFKSYLKQHHRWAIGALDLGWKAFVFVLTSFSLWVGIALSLIFWQPFWLLAFILLRLFGDSILTIPTALILKKGKIIPWILPSVFFFMFMELVAPFFLLKRNVEWKEQVF